MEYFAKTLYVDEKVSLKTILSVEDDQHIKSVHTFSILNENDDNIFHNEEMNLPEYFEYLKTFIDFNKRLKLRCEQNKKVSLFELKHFDKISEVEYIKTMLMWELTN